MGNNAPATVTKTIDEYALGRKLGEGKTSVVYEGIKKNADTGVNESFAIKVMRFENESERQRSMEWMMAELGPLTTMES